MKPQLLIFLLNKRCDRYGLSIVQHFDSSSYQLFVSKYYEGTLELPHTRVKTYTNSLGFLWSLFARLPFLLIRIVYLKLKNPNQSAYFPFFHHWYLPILLLCRILKIKTIFTVHDGILHMGEGGRLDQWWQNSCIKLADELIFLTEFVKNQTLENLKFKGNTTVSPHGINTPDWLELNHRNPSPKPRLLFLGRVLKYKGVELLIEAVESMKASEYECLTIAGEVRYPLEVSKNNKIQVIDEFLPEREMIRLLNEHDILILPYLEATQSGIASFGIATAIPMICTNVGGLAEQVIPEKCGIFVKPSSEHLRAGIRRLSSDLELYSNIHQYLKLKRKEGLWEQTAGTIEKLVGIGRVTQ